jgi:hypothetical protein
MNRKWYVEKGQYTLLITFKNISRFVVINFSPFYTIKRQNHIKIYLLRFRINTSHIWYTYNFASISIDCFMLSSFACRILTPLFRHKKTFLKIFPKKNSIEY